MAKKWTIDPGPARKCRLVTDTERDDNEGRTVNRAPRVRVVSRIVKCLAAIGLLSAASWLQACHHGYWTMAGGDGPHDAIGDDTINLM